MMQVSDPRQCPECGGRLDWRTHVCLNAFCSTNKVDWTKRPLEPGPVKMPTREELLADSRRGRWQGIDTLPSNRTVIITRQALKLGTWLLARHEPGEGPPYIYALPATHWAEDTIGQPIV